MLIDTERDTAAELRAEDEAIAAAESGDIPPRTALDELARILNGDDTAEVHAEG